MSTTPRTDAQHGPIVENHGKMVPASFAREIEEELARVTAEWDEAKEDTGRLDWLERKHAESNGQHYLVECSITYNGNTGAQPLFPATRAAIDAAMREHSR